MDEAIKFNFHIEIAMTALAIALTLYDGKNVRVLFQFHLWKDTCKIAAHEMYCIDDSSMS